MRSGISIRNQISLFSVAALVLFLAGCQGSDTAGTASVRITLNTNAAEKAAARRAAPAPSGIVSVTVDVSGPGMEPLSTASDANHDGVTTLALEVLAGPARRFDVTAFDNTGAARYQGSDTVDLVSGASVTLTIEMVVIQINPLQIDPPAAILTRSTSNSPVTQLFTMTNATTAGVDLLVNNQPGGAAELGQTSPGESETTFLYTAPNKIPIDQTNTPIGVPIPITIEAVDKADPDRRDAAQVKVVTGLQLQFGASNPVTTAFNSISTESSGQRSIAYHQGKVYAVWSQLTSQRRWAVFFSESMDGTTWNNSIPLSDQTVQHGYEPSISVGPDGTLYVAMTVSDCLRCSESTQSIQLMVRPAGEDEFNRFFGPIEATFGFDLPSPSVAVSPNEIIVVAWSGQGENSGLDIFLQRLNKDGAPIAPPQNLTDDGTDTHERSPALSINKEGEIYLAWETSPDIIVTVSLDGGNTFPFEAHANTSQPSIQALSPSLAAGARGTIYIAWEDCGDGCTSSFFNVGKVGPDGLQFGTEVPVGTSGGLPPQPSIAWDGANGIYIAYKRFSGGETISLAKSTDEGGTFSFSRIDIGTPQGALLSFPSIAVDQAGRAFTIWTQSVFNEEWSVLFAMGDDFIDE